MEKGWRLTGEKEERVKKKEKKKGEITLKMTGKGHMENLIHKLFLKYITCIYMHMFVIYILYTKRQTKIKSSHKA